MVSKWHPKPIADAWTSILAATNPASSSAKSRSRAIRAPVFGRPITMDVESDNFTGGARAEAARRGRRAAGDDGRRRRGRARDPRRADDPARRRPDRRRLRPLGARPHDPEGARDDPPAGRGPTGTCGPVLFRILPVSGRDGTLEDRMTSAARARQRPREDGHARQRLGALRLRPRALRLLDPPERAAALVLRRTGRAGPVRDGASRR